MSGMISLTQLLAQHGVFTPRGYANECCHCGWESDLAQPPEDQGDRHIAQVVLAWVAETLEQPTLIEGVSALIDHHVSRADRGAPFALALVQMVLTERSGVSS